MVLSSDLNQNSEDHEKKKPLGACRKQVPVWHTQGLFAYQPFGGQMVFGEYPVYFLNTRLKYL